MSGHSKWASIHRSKAIADQKRGAIFTKLGNAITIAAREKGGDPESNFSLRLTIEKAKSANMPKDNIERAIKRGTGELAGSQIEEIEYEGFGPGKIAVIVKAVTDNRNRAVADIKAIFNKYNGSLGGPGSVKWMFDKKGIIRIEKNVIEELNSNEDDLELKLIDLGADDIKKENGDIVIFTPPNDLQKVKESLEKENIKTTYAEVEFVAKDPVQLTDEAKKSFTNFLETLDDCEDVGDYFINANL